VFIFRFNAGLATREPRNTMKTSRCIALGTTVLLAFLMTALARGETPVGASAHPKQIWGSVHTEDRSTVNIFDKEVTVLIRKYHPKRLGRIIAFGAVSGGQYAVNMGDLPAGKYVVQVDPGGSEYGGGERIVSYPGNGGSVNQDWTLYLGRGAIPSGE
jgi:hypothetical protein